MVERKRYLHVDLWLALALICSFFFPDQISFDLISETAWILFYYKLTNLSIHYVIMYELNIFLNKSVFPFCLNQNKHTGGQSLQWCTTQTLFYVTKTAKDIKESLTHGWPTLRRYLYFPWDHIFFCGGGCDNEFDSAVFVTRGWNRRVSITTTPLLSSSYLHAQALLLAFVISLLLETRHILYSTPHTSICFITREAGIIRKLIQSHERKNKLEERHSNWIVFVCVSVCVCVIRDWLCLFCTLLKLRQYSLTTSMGFLH